MSELLIITVIGIITVLWICRLKILPIFSSNLPTEKYFNEKVEKVTSPLCASHIRTCSIGMNND